MAEKKHSCCNWWLMMLCCALPVLVVIGARLLGYQGYLTGFAWLLCPLTHGLIMWWMMRSAKSETN